MRLPGASEIAEGQGLQPKHVVVNLLQLVLIGLQLLCKIN